MAIQVSRYDAQRQLGVLCADGALGGLTDGELLERFLTGCHSSSEASFSTLVQRHGPMVLRVCRQVLDGSEDAEDAFQATFLILARSAGSVRRRDSVASWLHGVARKVAARARAMAKRRREYELQSAQRRAMGVGAPDEQAADWTELHEEVARLPARYREPVLLCYFEGMTSGAVAERLGCPQGTILARLSRARQRLRHRLTRRGLLPADGRSEAPLAKPLVAVLPAGLLQTTLRSALAFAGGQPTDSALLSSQVVNLARGGLFAMLISKSKAFAALAVLSAAASGWMQCFAWSSDRRDPAANSKSVSATSRPTASELQLALARQEPKAADVKPESSRTSEFPFSLRFEQGATRFLEGDKITILEVRGTADTIAPGNIYWIKGTYTLGSHNRAMLAAFTTAMKKEDGYAPYLKVQSATVDRGSGTFTLFLPMNSKGWPHVSFYPADGGSDFGGNYFGTGDSVLKEWWGSKKAH
jgi:RNA polymerase sigma factor (sigma-70 family)